MVHQCAQFSADTKLLHDKLVKRVLKYLKFMATQGLIMKPNLEKGIKCYVDANFAGRWNQEEGKDPGSVLSRMGYIITYANCLIIWASRIQKEIVLSTTETECISLSVAMRDVLPFVSLIK